MHKFVSRLTILGIYLLSSPILWALEVQIDPFFKIDKISYKKGRLVLPVTRRKYHNIKVLDEHTFTWLQTCASETKCVQEKKKLPFRVEMIRPVVTRQNMWIAEVSFAEQWLIVFLLFKNPNGYVLKEPDHFKFLDVTLATKIRQELEQMVQGTTL